MNAVWLLSSKCISRGGRSQMMQDRDVKEMRFNV